MNRGMGWDYTGNDTVLDASGPRYLPAVQKRCASCQTILSRYNKGQHCSVCVDVVTPTKRPPRQESAYASVARFSQHLTHPMTPADIAALLGLHASTVSRILSRLNKEGSARPLRPGLWIGTSAPNAIRA